MAPNQKKIYGLALLAVFSLQMGCVSTPPSLHFIDDAASSIERARTNEGDSYAPVEMGFARDQLNKARNAVAARKYLDAANWAAQAEVDSELAMAKARAAKARAAVQAKAAENSRMRAELLDEHDMPSAEPVKEAFAPAAVNRSGE